MAKKITRKVNDWEAIEKEYRLGQSSVRVIAKKFGVSHTLINRRVKKYQWVQNKANEVREKTQAGLIGFHEGVSNQDVSNPTPEDIKRAVNTNIQVVVNHRKDIKKTLGIVNILSDQLKVVAEHREDLESLITEETKGNNGNKPDLRKRNFMMKAVSLPVHAGVVKDLSMALSKLIPLERQAFNLDEQDTIADDLKSSLSAGEKTLFRKAAQIVSQKVIDHAEAE